MGEHPSLLDSGLSNCAWLHLQELGRWLCTGECKQAVLLGVLKGRLGHLLSVRCYRKEFLVG